MSEWEFVVQLVGKSLVHFLKVHTCQLNNMKQEQELSVWEFICCASAWLLNPRYNLSCAHACCFYSCQNQTIWYNNKNCAAWCVRFFVQQQQLGKSLVCILSWHIHACWFYSCQPNNTRQQELWCLLCEIIWWHNNNSLVNRWCASSPGTYMHADSTPVNPTIRNNKNFDACCVKLYDGTTTTAW
jgi:hypothetical protein